LRGKEDSCSLLLTWKLSFNRRNEKVVVLVFICEHKRRGTSRLFDRDRLHMLLFLLLMLLLQGLVFRHLMLMTLGEVIFQATLFLNTIIMLSSIVLGRLWRGLFSAC